jgi:hypothetical protein
MGGCVKKLITCMFKIFSLEMRSHSVVQAGLELLEDQEIFLLGL